MSDGHYAAIRDDLFDAVIKFKVKLPNGVIINRDVKPDLIVDYDLVEEQMTTTPSLYAFWSAILSEQRAIVGRLEKEIEYRRSIIMAELKNTAREMESAGSGIGARAGLRKDDIKDLMHNDDKLLELDASLIHANKIQGKLWGIVRAIEMKSDNLRSLAANKRKEMGII